MFIEEMKVIVNKCFEIIFLLIYYNIYLLFELNYQEMFLERFFKSYENFLISDQGFIVKYFYELFLYQCIKFVNFLYIKIFKLIMVKLIRIQLLGQFIKEFLG